MSELPVPEKANAGMSVEEMKMFVRDHFEDFVNKKLLLFCSLRTDNGPTSFVVIEKVMAETPKSHIRLPYRKRPRRY